MTVKTVVPTSYFGRSREVWQALSALIARVNSPLVPPLSKQFGFSRGFAKSLDALISVVSSQDHQQPSQLYGNRNWRYSRDTVATLVALEARITALGL
jgi:hypothetical protein